MGTLRMWVGASLVVSVLVACGTTNNVTNVTVVAVDASIDAATNDADLKKGSEDAGVDGQGSKDANTCNATITAATQDQPLCEGDGRTGCSAECGNRFRYYCRGDFQAPRTELGHPTKMIDCTIVTTNGISAICCPVNKCIRSGALDKSCELEAPQFRRAYSCPEQLPTPEPGCIGWYKGPLVDGAIECCGQ